MNRLANESSPYLAQHRNNPVDWWPWTDEAFSLAKQDDKPVFLSIGYASCHWCHVMAHESFEDPNIAKYLSENFISIKVDREERPDVDSLYMEAVQILTGSGGWPMSVFMTPDGRPFYGGTYFPPNEGRGMPSFITVLRAISNAWKTQRADLELQADSLKESIGQKSRLLKQSIDFDWDRGPDFLETAASTLLSNLDTQYGGFGTAPKFPQSSLLELLLSYYLKTRSEPALNATTITLNAMFSGGMYDHLGGGFARYSVDDKWMIPHFEKMLYDQAQLARIYALGWTITKNESWKQVATETIDYVLRDLNSRGEGLYSSQDADSEGIEGKYYLFAESEVAALAGHGAQEFVRHYGITKQGNFEGSNLLHLAKPGIILRSDDVENSRKIILEHRYQRIPPALDDKVILEWNAMFISTISQLGFILNRPDWIDISQQLLRFLESKMIRDGRWLRIFHRGKATQLAFSSDYAHLVDAYTRTYEATGNSDYLKKAIECAQLLKQLFEDPKDGGFFTTGNDQEKLIVRTKDLFDGALPSANSIAARSLARLAKLTDISPFADSARKVIALLGEMFTQHPSAFPLLVATLPLLEGDSEEIVIPGWNNNLIEQVRGRWLPNAVLAFGTEFPSPLWQGRKDGNAYICKGFVCLEPITNAHLLSQALDSLT